MAAALPAPAPEPLAEARQVLVLQHPDLAAAGVLAVQRGWAVAFDIEESDAEGLEALLAELRARSSEAQGPYAIGRKQVAPFLANYPEASRVVITAPEPLLQHVGVIAEPLPAVASALDATRAYLDSARDAAAQAA